MRKKLTTLVFAFLVGLSAWAYSFKVDGICYDIVSSGDLTVRVTYNGYYNGSYNYYGEYTGAVEIPSTVSYSGKTYSVTSIGERAFSGCSGLTSVIIPSSVTEIGDGAFYNCSKLQYNEYDNALYLGNAENPYHVLIKAKSTSITSCNINETVKVIFYSAFSGCSGLTSVIIPSSVTSIGNYAFYGCIGLTSVIIPSSVTSIGYSAFSGCSGLTSVIIPSSVTSIGYSAFSGCSGLTSVIIPSSVTSIGGYAFYGCSGLTSVIIPSSVTSIGSFAFSGCSGLTSVVIPSSVTSIGEHAFYDVTKAFFLTNTKPSIGSYAFNNCKVYYTANDDSYGISGTHKVYSLLSSMFEVDGVKYIPTSVKERTCDMVDVDYSAETVNSVIGPTVKYTNSSGRQYDFKVNNVNMYAGYGCKALSDVILKNTGAVEVYAFNGSSASAIDIDNTITTIGNYAFSGCTSATMITVSNNGAIGERAFSGCTSATTITVSNNGAIGVYAFSGCTSATTIIASNNGNIGSNAFEGCMTATDGAISVSNKGNINSSAFKNCTKATSIDIKNEGSLGESAFYGCSGAKEIKLGDAITTIGNSCFYGCSSLEGIKLSKNIASFGSECFRNCSSMTSVELNDKITTISSSAFSGCSKLASLTVPANVTSIQNNAFGGCTSIGDLTFEDSETPISLACTFVSGKNLYLGRNITYSMSKSSPFSGNNVLEKVTTNMNVTNVGDYAFYNCKKLKDVYLSDAVTTVGTYAFSGDVALEKFEVGISVESIGAEAFSDCTALFDFRSHSIVPAAVGTESLDDIDKLECTLHVPEGTKEAYEAADQWKEFWIEDDLPARYKVIATVDPECKGMGTVKGSNGYEKNATATLEAIPDEWHRFVEWSDGDKTNPRTITVTEAVNITAKFAYRYYIKRQPTANNISVALSEEVSGVQYNWYVSDSEGVGKDITNDLQSTGSYVWTKSNGVWTSGNKGVHGSLSTLSMSITAKAGEKLTFDYTVSSESGYDFLKVYLGSDQIGSSYSGSESGKYEYTFVSDMTTTLEFVYSKDRSQSGGSDQATISNVFIGNGGVATLLETEMSNRVSDSSLEADKYYYCEIEMPDGVVLTSEQVQYTGNGGATQTEPTVVASDDGSIQLESYDGETGTAVIKITPEEGNKVQYIFVDGVEVYVAAGESGQATAVTSLGGDRYSLTNVGKTSEISVTFNSNATAIDVIQIRPTVEGIYDIMGRKLSAPQRGINIINGKKVVVK